jgi:hypothetical protein
LFSFTSSVEVSKIKVTPSSGIYDESEGSISRSETGVSIGVSLTFLGRTIFL